MKVLTKGIFYYKPSIKKKVNGEFVRDMESSRMCYINQGLSRDKIDEYLNDDLVMVWHECEKWSKRPGTNRVSLKCTTTTEDSSHYQCAHCGFKYELDNHLALIESKG